MAKSKSKFYAVSVVTKSGKAIAVGRAFRFNDGTIYAHLDRKTLEAKCIMLEPSKGRH